MSIRTDNLAYALMNGKVQKKVKDATWLISYPVSYFLSRLKSQKTLEFLSSSTVVAEHKINFQFNKSALESPGLNEEISSAKK